MAEQTMQIVSSEQAGCNNRTVYRTKLNCPKIAETRMGKGGLYGARNSKR
jgi:hypothetical protein